jgi:CO dehydrogenase maturation factor
MKIAFVGKGGSGKSTLTALFIRHLQKRGRDILALDADLNMNLAGLLGVSFPPGKALARPENADAVRGWLKGGNALIPDISKFLPTTPPGPGSNLVRRFDEPGLADFAIGAGPRTRLMTVGTYDGEGIGQTCYHSHLFVAENMLSHTETGDAFDVVCDMVAGTDAFAYSLHLQFDAIVLIAEPAPESAEVCALYMGLAREAGIEGLVHLVGNKVADEDDLAFIRQRAGGEPLGCLPYLPALKKARQRGAAAEAEMAPEGLMAAIEKAARAPEIGEARRREMLAALHAKLNGKEWVKLAYGDVMGQLGNGDMGEAA